MLSSYIRVVQHLRPYLRPSRKLSPLAAVAPSARWVGCRPLYFQISHIYPHFSNCSLIPPPPPTLAGTGPGSGIRTGPRFRHSQGVCPSHRSSPRRLRLPPCFGKFPRLTPSGIYSRAALSRTCSSGFEFTSLQALRGSQCPTSTHPPSFSHNFAVGPCWIHRNRFCPSFCLCPGETNCRR